MSMRILVGSLALAAAVIQIGQAQGAAPAGSAGAPAQNVAPAATVPSCPELATALTRVAGQDARMRDWPQLGRYREANHSVKNAQAVFMGDSITDNWQQPRFGGFFTGKPYVDRGISGQTTPQMLLRFRADVIDLKPRVVVILAGTNDIAGNTGPMTDEEIQANLASMSELAVANKIKVVLASITPVSAYHLASPNANPQTSQRPMARIRANNDWIKAYAAKNGHVYLDYFSAMTDESGLLRTDLSGDDLHPNEKGYQIMGPLAEAAIARALK